MMNITIQDAFSQVVPHFIGAYIEANVRNSNTPASLWQSIQRVSQELQRAYDTESIKERPSIRATRAAYKAAGKDPSRYRPSCEQLARRVLQGKELYSIDTLVDLGNLVSLRSGYSVAVLDAEHIVGEEIALGIGQAEEPYEAIGRGSLNIAALPVYRDAEGAFATPTSDSVRTRCRPETRRVLVIINGYDGDREAVEQATQEARQLLRQYGGCEEEGEVVFVTCDKSHFTSP